MHLRIILLHDSFENCRKSISAINWLELISHLPFRQEAFSTDILALDISACVLLGPTDILTYGQFGSLDILAWGYFLLSALGHFSTNILETCYLDSWIFIYLNIQAFLAKVSKSIRIPYG